MDNSFYSPAELEKFKFKKIGDNVLISRKASIYSPQNIEIGDNVRIDDFCLLSGNISIGNYVHISAYTSLYGGGLIKIGNYCGCSPYCCLLSASDDFSGEYMVGAVIDDTYKHVDRGVIILEDYTQLGAGTIVLPNITVKQGSVTGARTLINKNIDSWGIYVGTPCKFLKKRSKKLLEKVKKYEKR